MNIVRMLDTIRVRMMKRLVERRKEVDKWVSNISPSTIQKLEKNMDRVFKFHLVFNGEHDYEVVEGKARYTMDLKKHCCMIQLIQENDSAPQVLSSEIGLINSS